MFPYLKGTAGTANTFLFYEWSIIIVTAFPTSWGPGHSLYHFCPFYHVICLFVFKNIWCSVSEEYFLPVKLIPLDNRKGIIYSSIETTVNSTSEDLWAAFFAHVFRFKLMTLGSNSIRVNMRIYHFLNPYNY